jgi:hypothetical protein
MSDEDQMIAEARARDEQRAQDLGDYTPVEQMLTLAEEVERLRKQVALYRPIIEAVAEHSIVVIDWPDEMMEGRVRWSDLHAQARAALAEANE